MHALVSELDPKSLSFLSLHLTSIPPKPRMCCTWQALTDLSGMITLTMIRSFLSKKEMLLVWFVIYLNLLVFFFRSALFSSHVWVSNNLCIKVTLFGTYYLKASFLPLNNDKSQICLFPNLRYSWHIPGGTENIKQRWQPRTDIPLNCDQTHICHL